MFGAATVCHSTLTTRRDIPAAPYLVLLRMAQSVCYPFFMSVPILVSFSLLPAISLRYAIPSFLACALGFGLLVCALLLIVGPSLLRIVCGFFF